MNREENKKGGIRLIRRRGEKGVVGETLTLGEKEASKEVCALGRGT